MSKNDQSTPPPEHGLSISVGSAVQLFGKIERLEGELEHWKIEASEWRRLFHEQRGGQAFTDLQAEVVKLRKQNGEAIL